MNRFFLIIVFLLFMVDLFAQKPLLDTTAYTQWPLLSSPVISVDGKYIWYSIQNKSLQGQTLIIQSTDAKWKADLVGIDHCQFTLDGKYAIYAKGRDSLAILTLRTNKVRYLRNISSFQLKGNKSNEFLCYYPTNKYKVLIIRSLYGGNEMVIQDVEANWFSESAQILITKQSSKVNPQLKILNWIDLDTYKVRKIWEGSDFDNVIVDEKHRQLAFKKEDSILYYKTGFASVVCISNRDTTNKKRGLFLGLPDSFSKNGEFIFTSLIKRRVINPQKEVAQVWSYIDSKLQTENQEIAKDQKYLAVINIADHMAICLQQHNTERIQFPSYIDAPDTFAFAENYERLGEPWSIAYKTERSLISIKNGERKTLSFLNSIGIGDVVLSPTGKYLIYFDRMQQDYFSYEISTSTIRNLTKGTKTSWIDMSRNDSPVINPPRGLNYLIWGKNDEFLLVYDEYDIWALDPLNVRKPVNITNAYGKHNKIIFNCAINSIKEDLVSKDEKLYLTAFNKENKNNGFFLKKLDRVGNPNPLQIGPYLYDTNSGYVPDGSNFSSIKAKNAEMYIVRRMSATDAPNYFSTRDFKVFTRLSDLQPQKKYNWYTTELHTWKSLDGRTLQGVLYKPENFDPSKKYPIIFNYYERKSDGLNAFIIPESLCNDCQINVPTYVSNGYLVFTPDIYYKIGDPMQGTYDAIISAASYVSNLPFVNDKKMGLQGCSFGGFQTNYLVTHTNLFAAAVTASGISNLISGYGGLNGNFSSKNIFEAGQLRMGSTLWDIPNEYIKNSPIFYIHKVTTPIVIMHTKRDSGPCDYTDAIQFFNGLRRLGKKAWMLVYSNGIHGLSNKEEADDFSIRMMQFFNHYLKDKTAPIWMLEGTPASNDRGIEDGFKLDNMDRITPGMGLLIPAEQRKADSLMTREPINITLK